jgi:hypothetical protein
MPVHYKMKGNKKEAKVYHDCQDPTEPIKKKLKKTNLIYDEFAGQELDARENALSELHHGDEKNFQLMRGDEVPVFKVFGGQLCCRPKSKRFMAIHPILRSNL